MDSYFNIKLTCNIEDRPPISAKVCEYLEAFVIKNIMEQKKIILGGKWKIFFGILFMSEGPRGPSDILFAAFPSTISAEETKMYEVVIPLSLFKAEGYTAVGIISTIFRAISIFFTTNYKRTDQSFMIEVKKKLDWDYLLSLPFPAPRDEQRYIEDELGLGYTF